MAQELTLIQMNDSHAYFEPHPELFWSGDQATHRTVGGYARIATLLNQIRREKPGRVLAFDGGDTIHGTYAAVETKGEALVPILKALRFEAMSAHWEFAYGPEPFKRIADALPYPVLGINCYEMGTDKLVFSPYTICETQGLRVGVIGILATIVDKTMPRHFSEGLVFTPGHEELPGYVNRLRNDERADVIVVVSHLGFPQEVQLAREVEGIDVVLSAHTHNRLYQPARINDTLIIQSGCHGSFIGRLDLQIENRHIVDYRHQLITVEAAIQPDEEVQTLVEATLEPYHDLLNEVVGQTATALNRNTVLEATMDNLLLQSLLHVMDAPIAFSNGWRYGAPVPSGTITMNDLYNIIPVNPPVSSVQMTGEEIWTMLEENLEHTFSRDPFRQMGGYLKRCLGITLYFKTENPYGQRIQELFVGSERIQSEHSYEVIFVTEQGVPAPFGQNRQQHSIRAVEALRQYLRRVKLAEAELRGTVVAV